MSTVSKCLPLCVILVACASPQDKQQVQQFCTTHGYQAASREFISCMDAYKTAQAHREQIKENCDREAASAYVTSDPALTDAEAKAKGEKARQDCLQEAKAQDKEALFQHQQIYLIERELSQ